MKLKIYPKSPASKHISIIKDVLNNGGLIIIPTDSVYAIACAANQPKAVKKLTALKKNAIEKSNFSFLFSDLTMVSEYTKKLSKNHFKIMNKVLPGPFTFILQSNASVNKIFPGKKTIGVRIPEHQVPQLLIRELGIPLVTTSLHDDDVILDYITDPELIIEKWLGKVDLIVDGGYGNNEASTVLDCTGTGITMIRQGIGEIEEVMV